jgi:hypothetical protein
MELHLEAITCLYLWPWSALYKVLISVSRHLTLGQASDEYINLAVSDRPEIYKFLYRKYGAGSSANLVDKSRRDKMMNSFTRVQYTRRSNHTEDIISPLLLVCCLAGGSCSCRIICLHGPWVGARTDAPRTRELRAWTGHKVILSCGAGLDLEAWAAATADPSALAVNFCSKRNTT